MKKLLGLLCEKFYKFFKKSIFILTTFLDIHQVVKFDLVVTSKCNSRCTICNIWRIRNQRFKDMPLDKIKQVLNEESLKNVKSFGLTGGEPFTRPDLYKIYGLVLHRFPSGKVVISTNGLLKQNILNFLAKITDPSKVFLIVSLNGIKKIDSISGVKNSLEKVLDTIRSVKSKFPLVSIVLKFTITPWNYNEILDVYELSKREKVGFMIKSIENLKSYITILNYAKNEQRFTFDSRKKTVILNQLNLLRDDQFKKMDYRASAFTKEFINYFSKKGYTLSDCTLSFYSMFIVQNGDVYLCRRFKPLGNLYKNRIDKMWNSKIAREVRHSKCGSCVSHYGYYNSLF